MRTNKAQILTPFQIKAESIREYNPSLWDKRIESYLKYESVVFYKFPKDSVYSYDRYYVSFKNQDFHMFQPVSYGSMLSNGGWRMVFIRSFDFESGETYPDGIVEITFVNKQVENEHGEYEDAWLNNSKEAVDYMKNETRRLSTIWTKE